MRKASLIILAITLILTAFAGSSFAGRYYFDNKDVQGTWYIHDYQCNPNWSGWSEGYVVSGVNGDILRGWTRTHDGYS